MQYTVGKYTIAPEKPFSSMDQAIRYIQKKFPELERETIEKFISPAIKEDGNDKSGNISEKDSDSQEADTEIRTASSERIKAGKGKPIQPAKG